MSARALAVLALLSASPSPAWPVDWLHDVEAGREKFVKLPRVDWFEVDDPQVLSVEWNQETNELILSGLKPGRALVLLGAEGKVAAWRVRVGGQPQNDVKLLPAAQKACPDLTLTPLDAVKLTVTVGDEKCLQALLALFQGDAFEARHLELTFDRAVLQTQLKSLQAGLEKVAPGRLSARYVGAGLVLEGKIPLAAHRKVLWEILRRTVGRFALDDRTEIDAGDAGR